MAPDLPADDESAGLRTYADTVVDAVGERTGLVVVGHSLGGFTAPLVCDRVPAKMLVLLAAMIPSPGEAPNDWWANSGYEREARHDDDVIAILYHDVPADLAAEALRRERAHPSARAMQEPWPLKAWPNVPTRFLLCRDDRFFPASFLRRLARERLGIAADEIEGGHCVYLSRPDDLAERLDGYLTRS